MKRFTNILFLCLFYSNIVKSDFLARDELKILADKIESEFTLDSNKTIFIPAEPFEK